MNILILSDYTFTKFLKKLFKKKKTLIIIQYIVYLHFYKRLLFQFPFTPKHTHIYTE